MFEIFSTYTCWINKEDAKKCIHILRKEKILRSSNDNRASAIHLINAIFWANVLLHIATVIQFNFEK